MMKLSLCIYLSGVMFVSWLSFLRGHKHVLMTLLSLEFIGVVAYFNLFVNLNLTEGELYFTLIYLTFLVCEGALGLSLLVAQIRGVGSDYLHTLNMGKW